MRKFFVLCAVAMLAASCAVAFTEIRGPDGRRAYVMNCNGVEVTRRDCARLARRLCPRGYHLVDERSMATSVDARRYRSIIQSGYVTMECN